MWRCRCLCVKQVMLLFPDYHHRTSFFRKKLPEEKSFWVLKFSIVWYSLWNICCEDMVWWARRRESDTNPKAVLHVNICLPLPMLNMTSNQWVCSNKYCIELFQPVWILQTIVYNSSRWICFAFMSVITAETWFSYSILLFECLLLMVSMFRVWSRQNATLEFVTWMQK